MLDELMGECVGGTVGARGQDPSLAAVESLIPKQMPVPHRRKCEGSPAPSCQDSDHPQPRV